MKLALKEAIMMPGRCGILGGMGMYGLLCIRPLKMVVLTRCRLCTGLRVRCL